jgi:hypothetical protein
VDTQKVTHPFVLVAIRSDRFSLSIVRQCGTIAGCDAEERRLIFGTQSPVLEEGHDHLGQRPPVLRSGLDTPQIMDISDFMGTHGLPLEEWRAKMTKHSGAFE